MTATAWSALLTAHLDVDVDVDVDVDATTLSRKFSRIFVNFRDFLQRDGVNKNFQKKIQAGALDFVKKSSKSEPSSRFFGRLKFWAPGARTSEPSFFRKISKIRLRRDDSFDPKIVEIGAILAIFRLFEVSAV